MSFLRSARVISNRHYPLIEMVTSFISSTPLLSNRSRHQVNRCARQIRVTPCATAVPRRDVLRLSAVIAASLAFPKLKGIAATMTKTAPELGEKIDSGVFGYAFSTPPDGWSKQIVTLSSARTATIFVRDKDGDSNINMVSTPVSGDFTKLSSFGSIDNVVVCHLHFVPDSLFSSFLSFIFLQINTRLFMECYRLQQDLRILTAFWFGLWGVYQ